MSSRRPHQALAAWGLQETHKLNELLPKVEKKTLIKMSNVFLGKDPENLLNKDIFNDLLLSGNKVINQK